MQRSAFLVLLLAACVPQRVRHFRPGGEVSEAQRFSGADAARARIEVTLDPVASGFTEPTDIEFPPGSRDLFVVTGKEGDVRWARVGTSEGGLWLHVDPRTESEEGLLGLAFHPAFSRNGRFFIHYTAQVGDHDVNRYEEWKVEPGPDWEHRAPARQRMILEVEEPFENHKGGPVVFGPDGFLYLGLGDGGFRADPYNHAQNPKSLLGKILRIDVDKGAPYSIPDDNPLVSRDDARPEVWALGFRNPWRLSFDSDGTLWVADVGQDDWEEIDRVGKGENFGWRFREGRHCFLPERDCPTAGFVDPVYEYGHSEGQAIIGGHVYRGRRIPALVGKYVFGDFVSARFWALDAAPRGSRIWALGKFPMAPSTFGRDADGEIYVGDFASGKVFRFGPP